MRYGRISRKKALRFFKEPKKDGRAWIEIDLSAIEHNVKQLKSLLPGECEIMAVVKADAYGLGAVKITRFLSRLGIRAFAVADICEAIRLRRGGVKGEILVLGPTDLRDAIFLRRYSLTQLLPDNDYADKLSRSGFKTHAHIAVDTGMRRLGIDASDITSIKKLFHYKNIKITGIGTHLAMGDSIEHEAVEYTKRQTERFYDVAKVLRNAGYDTGKTHVAASGGILNYPDLDCGYARAGIGIYGFLASDTAVKHERGLRPAVSIKARVAQVRTIQNGDSVSYGATFTATEKTKIAAVSIGYADGVPRQMSGAGGACLVHGEKAPIVGRICMDMIMIDVTKIDGVKAGDIVTIIGRDGNSEIRCQDFARLGGTITNDVFARLGSRMPRVYLNNPP